MSRTDLLPESRTTPFVHGLARFGDRAALITAEREISYRDLAAQVAATAQRLGRERRLVLLTGANTVDCVVVYLAALAAGHPVLLVPGDNTDAVRSLIAAYDPDVVVHATGEKPIFDERRVHTTHTLHPDLALLLSTSGSTGSPKLVRLSHDNLQANAESIARYLGIRDTDRAATTLPPHYCYGLSVINSHLLRGAGLILTGLSVVDSCFWDLFRAARGTSFAGVPYTFDLLDRVGFASMDLPDLRYLTQAGGRLSPERVASYAALGRRAGWELFVMYGQTEATARMAYLPPELAQSHPQAIGVPVPGGSFRLQPLPDRPEPDTGELVYAGPNVMLGYAEGPQDLALGRIVDELHTGDIARRTADGLYEIVGRRSRFAKILGLRIDPQRVEAMLDRRGIASCCVGGDDELIVAVIGGGGANPAEISRHVARECGLPRRAVRVRPLAELPRLPSGKPDYQAVRDLTRGRTVSTTTTTTAVDAAAGTTQLGDGAAATAALCRLYAEILDRPDVTEESSFVSLGGDSLSYVEMSIRLEKALGHLPANWHTRAIRDLRPPAGARGTRRRLRWLETSVALRAVSIVLIVGTHIGLFNIAGGAHLLLGVAGFNFARFHLTTAPRRDRIRQVRNGITRVAVPSVAWVAVALLLTKDYGPANLVLLHSVLGPRESASGWHFWFIEALVYILVAVLAVLAVPAVDRFERRFPYGLPMALLAVGLVTRYDLLGLRDRFHVPSAAVVFWLFALGWAAARAGTVWQRLAVTAAFLATVPGFFAVTGPGLLGDPRREMIIMAGLTLLVWVRGVPSVWAVNRVAGILAGSSLYIYLTHWQVFPRVDDYSQPLALLASLAAGVAYAAVVGRATAYLSDLRYAR